MERPWSTVEAPARAPGEPLSQLGHQGQTPLYVAARFGHWEVIQQLIAAGPLGVDLTSHPRVEKGSRCQSLGTGATVVESFGVKGLSRVEGRSMCSVHETVGLVHFHGGTPPDISRTVPSDMARC